MLSALGIERLDQMDGQDLTPILEGKAPERERPYFTLGYDNYSWARDERYAMFCLNDGSEARLYDLDEDPRMNDDISEGNADIVSRMYEDYILEDAGGEQPPIY